jgi:hypothetical protein
MPPSDLRRGVCQHQFLNNDDIGPTVECRTEPSTARLVIVYSSGDLQNEWQQRIVNVVNARSGAGDDADRSLPRLCGSWARHRTGIGSHPRS